MTQPPIVSFVIPVYLQEAYVAEAVASALAQTVRDIEVIVVDDGSTDGSAEVVASFDDHRLALLRRTNGGPSVALNDGMRAARGRFIAFLGGDDVAEPTRLSAQLAAADARDADLVFSMPKLIDGRGRVLRSETMDNVFRRPVEMEAHAIFRRLLIDGNFLCAPTCLMRRQLLEDVGFFRDDLIQLQDYDYWLRAAAAGKSFAILQQETTRYRRHASNLSGNAKEDAMVAELVECIVRALSDAPATLLAEAFRDIVPPHLTAARPLDRAMIALMHPRARLIGAAMILQSYLTARPGISLDLLPPARLGALISTKVDDPFGPSRPSADFATMDRSYMAAPVLAPGAGL